MGRADFQRRPDRGAPLFGEAPAERKSASHGEAGYARSARDFYPTEPWVTQALLAAVDLRLPETIGEAALVWEPAVGDGRMAAELVRAGYTVFASDIYDYHWPETRLIDFTRATWLDWPEGLGVPAAIVTNPPFGLGRQFVAKALDFTCSQRGKVAILQRHEFDTPKGNRHLFRHPFAAKLILPRRPRWSDSDKASPRFPYAWYLWDWRHHGEPAIRWLDEASA